MSPRPGEGWLADLGLIAKTRPVVVVSRYDENPPRVLVIYVPLTSEDRQSKYEVQMPHLPFLRLAGVANVQGIGSIPVKRLERRLGVLPPEVLNRIKDALRYALDLTDPGSEAVPKS
jgi:mRNA interferase MazF